jgi:hypothetical protein
MELFFHVEEGREGGREGIRKGCVAGCLVQDRFGRGQENGLKQL